MKLLIAGLLAIFAGVALAANQSYDDVPTGSLLVQSATQPVAISPDWHRESPRRTQDAAPSPNLVSTAAASPLDSDI